MKNITAISDVSSVSLSLLCTIHCLAAPLVVTLLPSLAGLPLENEAFHIWMVIAVLPISIYALTMGCKKHKRSRVLIMGGIGLSILLMTIILGHEKLGEIGEKTLTVIGASFVALGHIWNYRLCRSHDQCECTEGC